MSTNSTITSVLILGYIAVIVLLALGLEFVSRRKLENTTTQ